jgi:UDP-2,3-diacylglucosamine pyrophosphatase LpxH
MPSAPHRYRTVFISDVHLGTRGCQAELLLDFLREVECEACTWSGDIVDGWRMKTGVYWPQTHNDVVQKLLRFARKGVKVTYIPGNHDEFAREYCGVHLGGVLVAREAVHERPTAGASSSSTATPSTAWSSRRAGWPSWATGPTAP